MIQRSENISFETASLRFSKKIAEALEELVGGGGLSKKAGQHGWQMRKNCQIHWLKSRRK